MNWNRGKSKIKNICEKVWTRQRIYFIRWLLKWCIWHCEMMKHSQLCQPLQPQRKIAWSHIILNILLLNGKSTYVLKFFLDEIRKSIKNVLSFSFKLNVKVVYRLWKRNLISIHTRVWNRFEFPMQFFVLRNLFYRRIMNEEWLSDYMDLWIMPHSLNNEIWYLTATKLRIKRLSVCARGYD